MVDADNVKFQFYCVFKDAKKPEAMLQAFSLTFESDEVTGSKQFHIDHKSFIVICNFSKKAIQVF